MKHYDMIVIGAGQAGTPLAIRMAKAGYKTALIEKRYVGGTCINDGCIPSKTIIASAKIAHMAAHATAMGIHNTKNYTVHFPEIIQRKRGIVERFRNGSREGVEKTENLDLIIGTAEFTGPNGIIVRDERGEGQQYTGTYFFLNAGARPFIPPVPGLEQSGYLTSTSIMELEELPSHLVILGAGYVSLEFAQAFRRFGSKVTVIETQSRLLPKEDEDISEKVTRFLEEEEITVLTGTTVKEINRNSYGDIVLSINKKGTPAVLAGSHLLVATGRTPNTDILKPERAGIAMDKQGYIRVDEKLVTSVPHIYAMGDIKGGYAFTHISYNDYRIVFRNFTQGADLSTKDRLVPYCMYTDPELGRVGLTETEARQKGLDIAVARLDMSRATRGIIENQTNGLLKAVVDKQTKKILGAALLCKDGGEIMSVLQMAMQAGFTYEQVREHVFAHPTLSESLNNLFFTLDQ